MLLLNVPSVPLVVQTMVAALVASAVLKGCIRQPFTNGRIRACIGRGLQRDAQYHRVNSRYTWSGGLRGQGQGN